MVGPVWPDLFSGRDYRTNRAEYPKAPWEDRGISDLQDESIRGMSERHLFQIHAPDTFGLFPAPSDLVQVLANTIQITQMWPILGLFHKAVFDRIVMYVIHMVAPIAIIPDDMIIKPMLSQGYTVCNIVIFFVVVREITAKRLNKP